jgi:hypothetical protein
MTAVLNEDRPRRLGGSGILRGDRTSPLATRERTPGRTGRWLSRAVRRVYPLRLARDGLGRFSLSIRSRRWPDGPPSTPAGATGHSEVGWSCRRSKYPGSVALSPSRLLSSRAPQSTIKTRIEKTRKHTPAWESSLCGEPTVSPLDQDLQAMTLANDIDGSLSEVADVVGAL